MKLKYPILLVIFLIALASSLTITLKPIPEVCDPGEGCDIVLTSQWAHILGIKTSLLGTIAFSLLSLITFSQIIKPKRKKEKIILWAMILATIPALYFLYLQHFVLHAYCKYCLVVDIGTVIALIIILPIKWKKSSSKAQKQ